MMNCFINHKRNSSTRQRRQRYQRRRSSHFQRWLSSLNQTRFKSIVKISGIRHVPYIGNKFAINLYSFLNVTEKHSITDYAMYDNQPYRINCQVLRLEGPGVANQGEAVIVTAEVVSMRKQDLSFILPEKYRQKNLIVDIELPYVNSIIRFLFDPKKTIDPFEGLLLSFTRRNLIKRCIEEKVLFCPEKYEPLLQEIQASNLTIGKVPESKLELRVK